MTSTLVNNLITQSELSFKVSEEAKSRGLILRYDVIKYREQEINFLSDPSGVQCFAQWNNQLIDLGLNNIYYKEDICRFIDRRLDLITTFPKSPEFQGAQLEWFNNQGYRDIRLKYKGRILKVFLVLDFAKVNETLLISESKKILFNCGLLEE